MNFRRFVTHLLSCLLVLLVGCPCLFAQAQSETELEARLQLAGDNRVELKNALDNVPDKQASGLRFLILNMPQHDLKNLSSEFLLSNVKLAYRARAKAPWKIPDDIFLNDVLPYANIDEPRDPWRKELYELCKPIVKDCKTPAEAAQRLNETIFKELSVKYSTKRKRANQSPKESIEQGLASCTGLSIILVDACRSVGVPARLVGIPSWKNKRGNHTWVEIWDEQWHFTGAAEPSKEGLNHTWFQSDAALADESSKMHSIYAVSFAKRDVRFPMVWSAEKSVSAVNVTARYANKKKETASEKKVDVMFRAWKRGRTEREVVRVEVTCRRCEQEFKGKTKAGTADMNDMLTFELDPDTEYEVKLQDNGQPDAEKFLAQMVLKTDSEPTQLLEFEVGAFRDPNQKRGKQTPDDPEKLDEKSLNGQQRKTVELAAREYFVDKDSIDQILRENPNEVRKLAWRSYLDSPLSLKQKSDFDANQVTFKKHLSPYTIKEVGKRPKNGWPLFIAMHGGGGAPKRVNDSQWKHMQIYYKDQEQLEGYKYLALRAPNDTWNGFYDDYVYPLVENLIRQFIAFGDVDPNKVFIMGYSHGGYGAFSIGPKIPFRFAAVHASAAALTDGQTSAKTLRNTRFTFMVGEKDNAYGRRERCEKFAAKIDELKKDNEGAYPVEFMYKEGHGHGGLPDRDMISQMYEHDRNSAPNHVTWEMTDSVVKRFSWLKCDEPKKGQLIDARIYGNTIEVKSENCKSFSIMLDRRLIDPDKPIELKISGNSNTIEYKPTFKTLCQDIAATGDLNLAFDFEIKVNLEK